MHKKMDYSRLIVIVMIGVLFKLSSVTCYNENSLSPPAQLDSLENGCMCIHDNCGCCQYINWYYINGTVCANMTYLPHDYGLSFTVTYNNHIFYNETISARNPPPICFAISELTHIGAEICLEFCDLTFEGKYFHGCINVQATVYHVIHKTIRIGCFNLPIHKSSTDALFVIYNSRRKSLKYKDTIPSVIMI